MGLFGRHQLAFAFLIAAKVYETGTGALAENEDAEKFRRQLAELEQ